MASIKLRIRAASGGPTIRVQVPFLCSLQGLKDVLGPLISLPASSFSLSLNKQEEIEGPGAALLSSLGVTSGDLLFYIVNNQGQSSSPIHGLGNDQSSQVVESLTAAADRVPASESRAAARSAAADRVPARESRVAARSAAAAAGGGSEVNPHQQHQTAAAGAVPSRASGTAVSTPNIRRELCAAAAARRAGTPVTEQRQEESIPSSDSTHVALPPAAPDAVSASSSINVAEGAATMDVETDGRVFLEMPPAETREGGHRLVPIPGLLQRVLASEIGNIRQPSAYLVLAVHAMMLETGFVRVETSYSNSNSNIVPTNASAALEGYELPSGWSAASLVNLTYTLPELTRARESSSSSSASSGTALGEEALLRCQIVGNAVVVYGAVTGGNVHRVSLSMSKFLRENIQLQMLASPGENSSSSSSTHQTNESDSENVEPMVSGDCLEQGEPSEGGDRAAPVTAASMGETHEENIFRNIFELWKDVKDSLSLPLLSFMCERAGLPPPPSLLRLPTELKIKVFDSLPSIALANISCACSELRFLAASEELWKQKYKEEFGASGERAPGGRGWKSAFVREFENRKRRGEERREAERRFRAEVFPPGIIMRTPSFLPSFPPHFGGLDYFQGLGAGPSRGGGFGGMFGADVGVGGGGFKRFGFRGGPSGNHAAAFSSNCAAGVRPDGGGGVLGTYGDEDGVSFPGVNFDGRGVQAWPPVNSVGLRGPRSHGRLDGGGGGGGGGGTYGVSPVMEYPRRLDGGGREFQGLGPLS